MDDARTLRHIVARRVPSEVEVTVSGVLASLAPAFFLILIMPNFNQATLAHPLHLFFSFCFCGREGDIA